MNVSFEAMRVDRLPPVLLRIEAMPLRSVQGLDRT